MRESTMTREPEQLEAKRAIDGLTDTFFQSFCLDEHGGTQLHLIHSVFIPQGLIIKNSGDKPEITSLREFITPRERMLTNGTLTEFHESEISEKTSIFGNVAQRVLVYEKSGVYSGERFAVKGIKTIQFVKTAEGWKMSSLAWDDERDGFSVDATMI